MLSANHPARHLENLRHLSIGLLCAGLFVVVLTQTVQLWHAHQNYVHEAESSVSNLTNALEGMVQDTVRQADVVLLGIVDRAELGEFRKEEALQIKRLLRRQITSLPQVHGIFIYDEVGNWIVTDKDVIPPNANNSDRDYFVYHRTHLDRNVRIGTAIVSRSTGDLIIPVSRRINNPDGTFAGVALITLKVDYFIKYFQRFNIGSEGNITLAYNDGTIMARRPEVAGAIGSSIYSGVIFSQLLPNNPAGTALFKSTVDGVERVYSYNAFPELPIVAIAGIDLDTVLRPWWTQLLASSIVSIAIFLGLIVFFAALRREINRSAAVEQELERVSLEDPLTGLANRRNFNQRLRHEMSRATRSDKPLTLLMLDIDYFKRYNDEYGHVEGDRCIKEVAKALAMSAKRQEDLAARYGGEELVMLLPGCGESDAMKIAEEVRARIWELGIAHRGNPAGRVTVSIGYHTVASESIVDEDEAGFIQKADGALYRAKNSGRNQVSSYSD